MTGLQKIIGIAPGDLKLLNSAGVSTVEELARCEAIEALSARSGISVQHLRSYQSLCQREIPVRRRARLALGSASTVVLLVGLFSLAWSHGQIRFGAAVSALREGRLDEARTLARAARDSGIPLVPHADLLNVEGAVALEQAESKQGEEKVELLRQAGELFALAARSRPGDDAVRQNLQMTQDRISAARGNELAPISPDDSMEHDSGAGIDGAHDTDSDASMSVLSVETCLRRRVQELERSDAEATARTRRALARANAGVTALDDLKEAITRASDGVTADASSRQSTAVGPGQPRARTDASRSNASIREPDATPLEGDLTDSCARILETERVSKASASGLLQAIDGLERALNAQDDVLQQVRQLQDRLASIASVGAGSRTREVAEASGEDAAAADAPLGIGLIQSNGGTVFPSLTNRNAIRKILERKSRGSNCRTDPNDALSVLVFVAEGKVQAIGDQTPAQESREGSPTAQDRSPILLPLINPKLLSCYERVVKPILGRLRFDTGGGQTAAWIELRINFSDLDL